MTLGTPGAMLMYADIVLVRYSFNRT